MIGYLSTLNRELTESCEKLRSIAAFVILTRDEAMVV